MKEQSTTREQELSMASFASNLETARILWRRYRALVEVPDFPEEFAQALRDREGRGPDETQDCCDQDLVKAGILPLQVPGLVGAEFVRSQQVAFLKDGVDFFVSCGQLPEIMFLANVLNEWMSNCPGDGELYLADLLYQEITGREAHPDVKVSPGTERQQ